MEFRKLSELKEYPINEETRSISPSNYKRLKDDLTRDGQLKNLLIMPDGTIIGGNHRFKAMVDLGWVEARVDLIDFQEESEGWYAIVHGEPQRSRYYMTKEQAIFAYSLKDNDEIYATYNPEKLMLYADTFQIPYEDIHVAIETIPSFAQVVNAKVNTDKAVESEDLAIDKKPKVIDIICPHCGQSFQKEL